MSDRGTPGPDRGGPLARAGLSLRGAARLGLLTLGLLGSAASLAGAWTWFMRYVLRTGWTRDSLIFEGVPQPGLRFYLPALALLSGVVWCVATGSRGEDQRRTLARTALALAVFGLLSPVFLLLQHGREPDSVLVGMLWHIGVPLAFLLALALSAWAAAGAAGRITQPLARPLNSKLLWIAFLLLIHIPSLCFTQPWASWFYRNRCLGGDEPRYLLLTHSLAHDFDINIYNNMVEGHRNRHITWSNPYQDRGGGYYAERAESWGAKGPPHTEPGYWESRRYGIERIGLPLLIAPGYRAGFECAERHRYGVVVTLNVLLAFTMLNIYLLALRVTGRHRAALLGALTGGLSAPLFLYAVAAYTEPVAAALVIYCLRKICDLSTPGERERAGALMHAALGCAIAYLPWVHEKMLLSAGFLLVLYLFSVRPRLRQVLPVVLLLALSAGLQARYYWVLYGRWWPPHVHGHTFSLLNLSHKAGLWGVLLDQKRGIAPAAPWVLAGVAGLWSWARRTPRFGVWPLLLTVAFVLSTACFGGWTGGASPQPRYITTVMPVLAVGLAVAWSASRSRGFRAFILGSSILGVGQGLLAVAVGDFLPWHRTPWLQDLYPSVFRLDAAEWTVIGAWTALAGWLLLLNVNLKGMARRSLVWVPVAAVAVIAYGAGSRFLENARPMIVRDGELLADVVCGDARLSTFNRRIGLLRWMQTYSASRDTDLQVECRMEGEQNAGPPTRTACDPSANAGACALWEGTAEMPLDLPVSPLLTLYDGNYLATCQIQSQAADVAGPPFSVRLAAVLDGRDVASAELSEADLHAGWRPLELRLYLPDVARHLRMVVRVQGAGRVAVDYVHLALLPRHARVRGDESHLDNRRTFAYSPGKKLR